MSEDSAGDCYRMAYGRQAKHPDEFKAPADELETFDPDYVLGYFRRLETILDACPVRIYVASSLKHPWPYRLQNAAECYPASFWRSPDRILDSGISDPTLSNRDVLDHAVERHATAVVAKDYLHGQNRTTESIRDFVELHDPEKHPRAYFPLQPPYAEHYEDVAPVVEASHLTPQFMLGGLKDATAERRLEELRAFRDVAGYEPVAHGLGWGFTEPMVLAIREEPDLLDSVDTSTLTTNLQNGRILDKNWRSQPFARVDGHYQNSVMGSFEFAMALQTAHRLTEFNEDFETADGQTGLAEFGGEPADD